MSGAAWPARWPTRATRGIGPATFDNSGARCWDVLRALDEDDA